VDQAMTGDLVEHVLEEGHANVELGLAGAIQVDRDLDLGLQGVALDGCRTFGHLQLHRLLTGKGRHYRRAVAWPATGGGRPRTMPAPPAAAAPPARPATAGWPRTARPGPDRTATAPVPATTPRPGRAPPAAPA